MAGLTLDAGALIAADRDDRRFWSHWAEAMAREVVPVIPAAALAQAWRGPRQARLGQVVKACFVDPLEESAARATGELVGRTKGANVVDAAVVTSAARRGDAVLTGDVRDLRRLAEHVGGVVVVPL